MNVLRPEPSQSGWRREMLIALESDNIECATDAMLAITMNDPDREWIEEILLARLDQKFDTQLRALAITCLGHLSRLHRRIGASVPEELNGLVDDPDLGGFVADALEDIARFTEYR